MKRGILHRTTGLARTKRMRPMSAKRIHDSRRRAVVRFEVFERDHWTCQASLIPQMRDYSSCAGVLTYQHILRASQGGAYSVANGTTLCSHHNSLIESDANFARLARHYGISRRGGGRIIAPVPAVPPAPPPAGPGDSPTGRSPSIASWVAGGPFPSPVGGSVDEYEREQC